MTNEQPDDVIEGPDPSVSMEPAGTTVLYECTACGWQVAGPGAEQHCAQHLLFGHPASRSPRLTCLATPLWSDRVCIRAKDHQGQHWSPSPQGGHVW